MLAELDVGGLRYAVLRSGSGSGEPGGCESEQGRERTVRKKERANWNG